MNKEILYKQFMLNVNNMYNLYISLYNNSISEKIFSRKDHEYIVKTFLERDHEQVLIIFENRINTINNNDLKDAILVSKKSYHNYDIENLKWAISQMTTEDINMIKAILRTSVEGPFFPDWEFHTLFGIKRDAIRQIMEEWPRLKEENQNISLAINNAFNNLLFYPHGKDDSLEEFLSISKNTLKQKYKEWKMMTRKDSFEGSNSSSEYFHNME